MRLLKYNLLVIAFSAAIFFNPSNATGQNLPPADSHEYYYRILQVSDRTDDSRSFLLNPVVPVATIRGSHPWQDIFNTTNKPVIKLPYQSGISIYEPVLFNSYNTSLPRGSNDGAAWQGKGANFTFSAGFRAEAGPLMISFRPQAGIAQNLGFDLGPHPVPRTEASEYAYRHPRFDIDYVQRFGADRYSWTDLGDSYIELRTAGFAAGVSNSRIRTGAGQFSSLQFGYHAPGFLHAHFSTYRPVMTPVGGFEFKLLFGGIRKSDYFAESENLPQYRMRMRSIHSLSLVYSPHFVKGLSVGAIRTFIGPYPESFSDYRSQSANLFEALTKNAIAPDPSDSFLNTNQIISVFARWVIPEAGFEIYGEYGRADHNIDLRDFRAQPNHMRAYIAGFMKTFQIPSNRILSTGIEIMQGETPRSGLTRGGGVLQGWYSHAGQPVGFTNRGQIIGSGFSPGSNYQMVWADLFDKRGKLGFKAGRIVHHNGWVDRYFGQIRERNSKNVERWEIRNTELLLGINVTAFLKYGIEVSAEIDQSFIFNHHYILDNDIRNTRFELVFRKQIDGWLR